MRSKRNKIKSEKNIRQAWVKKDLEKSPRLKTISKYLKLYCEYSSLNSLKYFANSQRPWFERMLWVIIHFIIISSVLLMVYIFYREFVTVPLITSVETDNYKTTTLTFPGIAICSINRLSRQSTTELVTNIFNANITNRSTDEILNLIMQLGNLYSSTFDMDNSHDMELDKLLTTYYNGSYDINKIMKALTPQCSMMLLKCKLHGFYRNCSQLFKLRKTQDGYCCTFNYVRESDDIPELSDVIEPPKPYYVSDLGIEHGLTVVMDPLLDDYLYSILPLKGWKVILFKPNDYPDVISGGVTEILVTPLTETFLDVVTTLFVSDENIKIFPIDKRNCIFSHEGRSMFSMNLYSYSDCVVDCKIYYIQKLCGCRPFFYPRRGKKEYSWRVCNILDVKCLSKYKSNLMKILFHKNQKELFKKEENVLLCHDCYPTCEDLKYDVFIWDAYMTTGGYNTNLLWNYNITNEAILHIYFSEYGTIRLKQDVSFHWYDLLSDFGGVCGIFIGFSFISIMELLYFFALMFRDLLCKKSALQKDDDDKTEIPSIQTQTGTIYWKELLPQSWHSAKYGKFSTNRARY